MRRVPAAAAGFDPSRRVTKVARRAAGWNSKKGILRRFLAIFEILLSKIDQNWKKFDNFWKKF